MESAKAEGEKIRLIGAADARAVEAVGRWVVSKNCRNENLREVSQLPESAPTNDLLLFRAEAERMRMKASAYKQYGDAAILSLVLESLPQVTTWDNSH